MQAFNQKTVKCINPACAQFDRPKTVSLPLIGNGLYLGGGIYCECGFQGECIPVEEE